MVGGVTDRVTSIRLLLALPWNALGVTQTQAFRSGFCLTVLEKNWRESLEGRMCQNKEIHKYTVQQLKL